MAIHIYLNKKTEQSIVEPIILHELVTFSALATTARKLYNEEMQKRCIILDKHTQIAISQYDQYLFSDHNDFFTELSYLVAYLDAKLNAHNKSTTYILCGRLNDYKDFISERYPDHKFDTLGIQKRPQIYYIARSTKITTVIKKFLNRVSSLIEFITSLPKTGNLNIIVEPSDRYQEQTHLIQEKTNEKYHVLRWSSKARRKGIRLNDIFLTICVTLETLSVFLRLIFKLKKYTQQNFLTSYFINHKCLPEINYRIVLNIALILIVSRHVLNHKGQSTTIWYHGNVDVMSRVTSLALKGFAQRVFLRQNIQCATVEPAFADVEKIILPELTAAKIFNLFHLESEISEEICVCNQVLTSIKAHKKIQKQQVTIVYIDESIPDSEAAKLSRIELLNETISIVEKLPFKVELIIRPHPTVSKLHFSYERIKTKQFSQSTIVEDLKVADVIIGRQSTALLTAILANKETFIVDLSENSYFHNSKQFYNKNKAVWLTDLVEFKKTAGK